jgi:hypothetical protein
MLRVKIVHIGNVLEVEKLLNTLGVFVKRNEITYWPCYDIFGELFRKKTVNGKEIGHTSNSDDSVMQLTEKIALDKYCRGTIYSPM